MRTPSLVAEAAAVALLPAFAVTSPAPAAPVAAKAVKVTLKDLPPSADAGTKVTVAGTAKGKKADRVTVLVQRRYGAGAWTTVGKDTTDKKGKYSLRLRLVQGGPTAFRAKVGGRTSPVESLAVYAWLPLAEQPQLLVAAPAQTRRTSLIGGRAFPDSYEFIDSDGLVVVKPGGLCTAFEVWTGFLDAQAASVPDGDTQRLGLVTSRLDGETLLGPETFVTPAGPAVRRTFSLAGAGLLQIQAEVDTDQSSYLHAVLGSPRLRCNATRLPTVDVEELGS
jgi:hypothetical protein